MSLTYWFQTVLMVRFKRVFSKNSILNLIRGSTRKKGKAEDKGGSRAIREMIKAKQRNEVIVFSPDGPRGPNRKVNGQVTKIAEMLELPIIPICYSVKKRKILNNWDQYMVPKPFNKGVFLVGNPIPPERANDLEFELNKLTDEADFAAASFIDSPGK